jgi:exodeoxyribonuclease VII large subunit
MQFYGEGIQPITVSQLNQYLKEKLEHDDALKTICIEGEISNLTLHTSGHIYFTLKDAGAAIRAVMFRGYRATLKFIPANGMHVLLIGDVALYERSGSVQLYVQRMIQAGVGEVYFQFEQLKQKLETEGLFDEAHKKSIPKYPEKICLVTSPTGAALQDMRNILRRRYPLAKIELCPTGVQGQDAVQEILRALALADQKEADIILLARGGGSLEDLYVFNNEKIARAIYAANTPIITGIGHETDFTIADFVADLRAPTPSAAAELAAPNQQDILLDLLHMENRLSSAVALLIQEAAEKIDQAEIVLKNMLSSRNIQYMQQLQQQKERLHAAISSCLQTSVHLLQLRAAKLEANNPLSICAKGYGRLQNADGQTVTSITQISLQSQLSVYLADGCLSAIVINKEQL